MSVLLRSGECIFNVNQFCIWTYSRYRAIPAIDIDIRDISVGTLFFRSSQIPRCAECMHAMQSPYLSQTEDSKHSHEFLMSLHRRQTISPLDTFLILLHRFISLFNSARLQTAANTVVMDQPMCASSTYMHNYAPYNGCGSHSSNTSGYFKVKYRYW